MNDAIGKRERGVWIGVYVLVEVFAFAAYLFAGALVMTGRKDGMMLDEVWDVIQILLFLVIAAVEIGYALIWRMAVMYRGIRHRTFWIVLNIISWVLRANLILISAGVVTEDWMSAVPEPLSTLLFLVAGFSPSGLLYVVLVWHDIVIWLNEPKERKKK